MVALGVRWLFHTGVRRGPRERGLRKKGWGVSGGFVTLGKRNRGLESWVSHRRESSEKKDTQSRKENFVPQGGRNQECRPNSVGYLPTKKLTALEGVRKKLEGEGKEAGTLASF